MEDWASVRGLAAEGVPKARIARRQLCGFGEPLQRIAEAPLFKRGGRLGGERFDIARGALREQRERKDHQ